ncbi:hypothetical protein HMSLTHF_07470 [Vreelandella aquamarina]|uniref:Uncharacterized protein n=1 Tax=Vreelandella aquamarina TaxID=77097 RepID=A0A6F8STD7_9GAMM|nr:hypothetical protein HMSLTHF_07470 [Halomonas meridiana]
MIPQVAKVAKGAVSRVDREGAPELVRRKAPVQPTLGSKRIEAINDRISRKSSDSVVLSR